MSKIRDTLIQAFEEAHKNEDWFKGIEKVGDLDLQEFLTQEQHIHSEKHSGSRWWNNTWNVVKIGERYFSYMGAETTGDMSPWEAGWQFDWNSVEEVEPYDEVITITKYRNK